MFSLSLLFIAARGGDVILSEARDSARSEGSAYRLPHALMLKRRKPKQDCDKGESRGVGPALARAFGGADASGGQLLFLPLPRVAAPRREQQ